MKHLPNLLTLANLFFGCAAITFILDAPAFLTTVTGERLYTRFRPAAALLGKYFIGIAALCDVLDGLTARGTQYNFLDWERFRLLG